MTWVKLDDQFADHPKLLQAGPLAGWLHVAAMCYAARYKTNGFIPHAVVQTLASFDGVGLTRAGQLIATPMRVNAADIVPILVSVELWAEEVGGYQIHDFLEYNPSKEEIEARRTKISEIRAEAGKRSGFVRRLSSMKSVDMNKRGTKVEPVPVPVPLDTFGSLRKPRAATPKTAGSGDEKRGLIAAVADALKRHSYPPMDERLKSIVASTVGHLIKGGYSVDLIRSEAVAAALSWNNGQGFLELSRLRGRVLQLQADNDYTAHEAQKSEESSTVSPEVAALIRPRAATMAPDAGVWSNRCITRSCLLMALYGRERCGTHEPKEMKA